MMIHHDSRPYAVAASEAARSMRDKLHRRIESGRAAGAAAIERIMSEIPTDRLVPGPLMRFAPNGVSLDVHYGDTTEHVHPIALGQLSDLASAPRAYLQSLLDRGDWGRELAADVLTRSLAHDTAKHLVRSHGGTTRAVLSTKYRRRDPGVLLEAFQSACARVGAVPYEATVTDSRWVIRAVLPEVVEPVANEVLALGIVISESPWGLGATSIATLIERCWCTNTAIRSSELRAVHVGSRLDDGVAWSEETVAADTRAIGLQIGDLVRGQLGPEAVGKLADTVRAANDEKIEPGAFEGFLKKHLTRDESAGVVAAFSSAEIQNLPPGPSVWRASNALSWFAHGVSDPDRQFEIEKLAGAILKEAA